MSDEDVLELTRLRREKRKLLKQQKLQEFANTCNRIGEILSRMGKYDEALEEHLTEEATCVDVDDAIGVAIANRKIGECHLELEKYDLALTHQQKHLEIAVQLNDVVEQQRALATIGRTYLCQADATTLPNSSNADCIKALNCAEEAFLKSLNLCSQLSSKVESKELAQMKARLFLNLGLVLDQRNDLDGCEQFIQKAIAINREHNLYEDLLRCHHTLSLISRRCCDLNKSLDHVQRAMEAATKISHAETECELLVLKGQILISLSQFREAKSVLSKVRRRCFDGKSKDDADRFWKIASKLCVTEDHLSRLNSDDESRGKLYEKMGDLYCKAQNFEKGLHYYHQALEFANLLGYSGKDLCPIYSSLAQTYSDVHQYNRAAHYYRLELSCWTDNLEESCKTLLNIAECEEFDGKSYDVLERLYERSVGFARDAGSIRLHRRCLHSLSVVQNTFGQSAKHNATRDLLQALTDPDEPNSDFEHEEVSDDSSEPPESEDFTSDDESHDSCSHFSTRNGFRMRRNDKGETPLHRACIEGNLKQVKMLLDQRHPVNVRDNSGWLPLHEAVNHDHVEIVKILLDKGAWINDRGGRHCDGITPLHDAASNGNFEVMEILLKRGASVLAKTDSGETILSLRKWRERARDSTDVDILEQSKAAEEKLIHMSERTERELQGVRKSVRSNESIQQQQHSGGGALLSEEELQQETSFIEDWLIDDMGEAQSSCRKRRRCHLSPVSQRNATSSGLCPTSLRQKKRNKTQPREQREFDENDSEEPLLVNSVFENFLIEEPPCSLSPFGSSCPEERVSTTAATESPAASLLRIKVKILDKLLLVPVSCGDSVALLSVETTRRYYALYGLRPIITLATKEGALLAAVDVVSHVISPEEEVVGIVESWELPPLNERYIEACNNISEKCYGNILEVLRGANETVRLSDFRLTAASIKPVLRALQCQYSLTELFLAGNRFGNDGLSILAQSLVHLPGIRVLDLSCNDISDDGLGHITDILSTNPTVLQQMEVLKLGFNPILEKTCKNLKMVLAQLKSLKDLHLPSCCTKPVHESCEILTAISGATHLQHLEMSYCCLSAKLLANLGNAFRTLPLKKLELCGVGTCPTTGKALSTAMAQFVEYEHCQLITLVLSHCLLDDECFSSLQCAITKQRPSTLEMLDITSNPGISKELVLNFTSSEEKPQGLMIQI